LGLRRLSERSHSDLNVGHVPKETVETLVHLLVGRLSSQQAREYVVQVRHSHKRRLRLLWLWLLVLLRLLRPRLLLLLLLLQRRVVLGWLGPGNQMYRQSGLFDYIA
jgi:hypothetical protein